MHVDMRTCLLMVGISELLYGLLLGASWAKHRREPSLEFWFAASLCTAAGGLLYALRGQIPNLLSVATGDALFYLTWTLRWAGLRRFFDLAVQPWQYLSWPFLMFVLYAFSDSIGLDSTDRTVITCSCGIPFEILMIAETTRVGGNERLFTRHVLIATCVFALIFEFVQITLAIRAQPIATKDFMAWKGYYPDAVLVFFSSYAVLNLATFMMLFERHENRLVRAARLDGLTGLLNRAGFNTLAERQKKGCAIGHEPVSVLVMDLDFFKKINDTYGHDAGDAVLCAFARSARDSVRPGDLLSRPGGEEFWALLPDTDLAEARRIGQRICDQFRGVRVTFEGRSIGATVSIGAAELSFPEESIHAALSRADQALYAAKHDGRDRVITAAAAPPALLPAHA